MAHVSETTPHSLCTPQPSEGKEGRHRRKAGDNVRLGLRECMQLKHAYAFSSFQPVFTESLPQGQLLVRGREEEKDAAPCSFQGTGNAGE